MLDKGRPQHRMLAQKDLHKEAHEHELPARPKSPESKPPWDPARNHGVPCLEKYHEAPGASDILAKVDPGVINPSSWVCHLEI